MKAIKTILVIGISLSIMLFMMGIGDTEYNIGFGLASALLGTSTLALCSHLYEKLNKDA